MSIRTTLLQSSLLRHLVIASTKERNMEIAEVIFLTLLSLAFTRKEMNYYLPIPTAVAGHDKYMQYSADMAQDT